AWRRERAEALPRHGRGTEPVAADAYALRDRDAAEPAGACPRDSCTAHPRWRSLQLLQWRLPLSADLRRSFSPLDRSAPSRFGYDRKPAFFNRLLILLCHKLS